MSINKKKIKTQRKKKNVACAYIYREREGKSVGRFSECSIISEKNKESRHDWVETLNQE